MKRNSVNHNFGVQGRRRGVVTTLAPAILDGKLSDSKTKSVIYPFEYDAANFQNLFASFDYASNSR